MTIASSDLKQDESRSNPMAVAMGAGKCPLETKRPCFWIVVGPGTPINICEHLDQEPNNYDDICRYGNPVASLPDPAVGP